MEEGARRLEWIPSSLCMRGLRESQIQELVQSLDLNTDGERHLHNRSARSFLSSLDIKGCFDDFCAYTST